MARSHTTDRDLGLKRIMRELEKAKTATVEVGIHEGSGQLDGVTIAQYAMYNEYGTSRIPERSFMRSTFDEKLGEIKATMDRQYNQVITGNSTVFRALSRLGMEHETDIKQKIRDLKTPPNAKSTIAKKGSDNPLIDTGTMLNTVRYVVKGQR